MKQRLINIASAFLRIFLALTVFGMVIAGLCVAIEGLIQAGYPVVGFAVLLVVMAAFAAVLVTEGGVDTL